MKILLDIGHPAHVHLYRNFYFEMIKRGHLIYITVRDIPAAIKLLESYNIPYKNIGKPGSTITMKGFNQIRFNLELLVQSYVRQIDIGMGSSLTTCQVSRLSPMRSILFDDDDDDVQPLMTRYGHPFAHCVLSPDALKGKRKKKDTVYYSGYHELAYLHPSRFTPDISVLEEAGLLPGEPFFIMRFNAFKAHHDIGIKGLSVDNKIFLSGYLSEFGKVLITTEKEIEPELKQYQINIPPHRIHSLLAFATMFVGDSQTMTSEASVLGVPSLRCNSFAGRISYLEEQEKKYGLTYAFVPEKFDELIIKLKGLLNTKDLKEEWRTRRDKMLEDKIDVTEFMIWFVENYPGSKKIMLDNSDFEKKFIYNSNS